MAGLFCQQKELLGHFKCLHADISKKDENYGAFYLGVVRQTKICLILSKLTIYALKLSDGFDSS